MMQDPEQVQRVLLRLAEQRISEAIEAGVFENLPGAGQPISDLDEAYDELWWVKKWLRRERTENIEQQSADERFRLVAAIETLRISKENGTSPPHKPVTQNKTPAK